jgi:hypothetical protein
MRRILVVAIVAPFFALLALGACGPPAGTRPHDMSIAQHEAAATREEGQATQIGGAAGPCQNSPGPVCWSDATSSWAAERRNLAARHRAAAQALREAEARACAGLTDEDRDTSPFSHGTDIRSVSQLREERQSGKASTARDTGATIVFRSTPGLTAEWLQRILDCHLARNAAVGYDMPEMPDCPLVPRGASAKVRSVGDGLAVDVRSDDATSAAEIWRRAQAIHVTP